MFLHILFYITGIRKQIRVTTQPVRLQSCNTIHQLSLKCKAYRSYESIVLLLAEHLCELGYITVTNLLPNQMYKEVLVPSHIHGNVQDFLNYEYYL